MENSFFQDAQNLSTVEALYEAQKIAFAPIVFQVARVLRDTNILNILSKNKNGLSIEELSKLSDLSIYAIKVLSETAISANILYEKDNRLLISKIGIFINSDKMTKVNMNYNHYVNYLGLYNLEESIKIKNLKVYKSLEIGKLYIQHFQAYHKKFKIVGLILIIFTLILDFQRQ